MLTRFACGSREEVLARDERVAVGRLHANRHGGPRSDAALPPLQVMLNRHLVVPTVLENNDGEKISRGGTPRGARTT